MKGDFALLYSRLGLRPDCTLAEFKRAYRLRIGKLHPDKGPAIGGPETDDELTELIRLYTTATRFHRRHGRLPGARSRPAALSRPTAGATCSNAAADDTGPEPGNRRSSSATEPHPQRPLLFASLLVATVTVLALSWDWRAETAMQAVATKDFPTTSPAAIDGATSVQSRPQLELGMDPASVLAIQGKPVSVNGDRWDYGPSWLRFADGRLVDWHSSPLRRLDTATPSPDRSAQDAASQ
ncbi:hypothetical protein N792_03765 [Lysobacter concretionis Ko07 = DSM 16239]|jgi:hypothetical protein|uniref:J domain-containing protein n=1 Tax=Lysobacter concretionis Ko07 = DSM 16239 TaxID=1122185 RepID=A0A0A0ER43_9GAMM|nr:MULTISPECIES: J domain-containing protein [Lysobacter]KGM52628.1 hypothetical protein N792_03765 [Lysobacter concretionis Ko07 = DSM 16239]QOD92019.1 J domain-containing protein [Lysobacter sp. CW239]